MNRYRVTIPAGAMDRMFRRMEDARDCEAKQRDNGITADEATALLGCFTNEDKLRYRIANLTPKEIRFIRSEAQNVLDIYLDEGETDKVAPFTRLVSNANRALKEAAFHE